MTGSESSDTTEGNSAPGTDPRLAAAAAMRRLGHAMVAHETDADLLRQIATQAAATAAIVEAGPRRTRPVAELRRQMWESPPPDGGQMAHFVECMVSGQANPMGVGMTVRREGDRAIAEVHLGAAFEGAPLRAHGGVVAAILDDVMGYVLLLHRTPAFTGRLTVTYLSATPVQADLIATAWLDRREDRKLHIAGTLETAAGMAIARAEGLFIAVPADRITG
ncbi:PaaI family thioesterase [soil metagenome]